MDPNNGIQIGVTNGIIIGFLLVILYLGLYMFKPDMFFNSWIAMGFFVVILLFMVKAALENRKGLGGYASFKQTLQPAFVTFLVAQLISTIFNYVLYNYIDPSLVEALKQYTVDFTRNMFEGMMSEAELEQQIETVKQQDYTVTFGSSLLGFLWMSVVGFVLAAIVAAFTRKKAPPGYYQQNKPTTQAPLDV